MPAPAMKLPRGGEIIRPPGDAGIDLSVLAALAGTSLVSRNTFFFFQVKKYFVQLLLNIISAG